MIGRSISHYTVLERLGAGGMGVVYKAVDTKLDRFVALKFLSAELNCDENVKRRFIHEAKAASALDHPNICTIYEISETEENSLFIAMAYYEGDTLKKILQSSPLSMSDLVNIALQMANGLAKAHDCQIVHRDIKPANVILTKSGAVKILDFGLAKLTGQTDLSRTGSAMGTAAYMSPEQAQGLEVGHRSDIWAWGVVLYEMLTRRLPFQGENHLALFHSIVSSNPVRASELRQDLSSELDEVLMTALQKDPVKRFSSMSEAAAALQAAYASSDVNLTPTRSTPFYAESKLLPSSNKAEKKQVTILKSEIFGYADLLEHLSGQEVQSILTAMERELKDIAATSRAIINDFSGDSFTLIFGIPTAGEDDIIRALRSALTLESRIRTITAHHESRVGVPILLQSGIATGLIVVRPSSSSERKFELTGNAMQVASGLAMHADPGEIWIDEKERRRVDHLFETEMREEVSIKGRARRIKAVRVIRESAHSRFDLWKKEELTAYVGRSKELDLINERLEMARRGEGQFVAIIGEAGVGKSRLVYEFQQSLEPRSLRILQGGDHLFATNIAYAPFIEALSDDLNLPEKGKTEEVVVQEITLLDPSLVDFIPVYLHLLAIPSTAHALLEHLQGKELQLAIAEALSAFVLSRKDETVLLVMEDWHAADEASKNLLTQLQEMIPEHPVMIVVACRPECSFRAAAHHTTIYLGPLDLTSSRAVITSALGVTNVPAELIDLIVERTGGNPFFIEEICRNLKEEGIVRIEGGAAIPTQSLNRLALPDTIQSVIGSRLDRIGSEARDVLEIASVVGREFSRSLMQKLVQDETKLLRALEHLKTLGLIQQMRVLPEATYKFKHPLVQETAYEELLAHERKKLHGSIGMAIEEIYGEQIDQHLDSLARHFSMAEEWDKAVQYGRRSAKKLTDMGQFHAALRQLVYVLEWLNKMTAESEIRRLVVEVLLEQERVCETLGIREQQEEILNRVISTLQEAKEPGMMADAYRRLGELYSVIGRFDQSERVLNESLRLSKEIGDPIGERNAHRSKGFLSWQRGRYKEAQTNNELALEIDRIRNDREGLARDLMNLSTVFRSMGKNDRALECAEEALRNYETIEDPVKRSTGLHIVANVYRELGDNTRALNYLEQALDIASRYRMVITQSFHLRAMASILRQQGKIDESFQLLKQCMDSSRKSGYADGLVHSLHMTGELLIGSGKQEEALKYLEEAAWLFWKLKNHPDAALAFTTVASIHEKNGRIQEAILAWSKVKDLRKSTGDSEGLLLALEALGRLSRKLDDFSSAITYYMEALEATYVPEKKASLSNTLGILEWKRGNYESALRHYRSALEICRTIGDFVHAGLMLNSIGVTLKNMGQTEEAAVALKEAVEMNRKTNQRLLEGHSLSALGEVHYESGKYEEAADSFRLSLAMRREIGDRRGEGWMLYQLARTYVALREKALARECFAAAVSIAGECGEQELIHACKSLESVINAL